jgi:DNA-binding Xre family transcriptional regulator
MVKTSEPKLKNRLFELIQRKELKTKRRITQHEIAEFAEVRDHTIAAWIRNDDLARLEVKIIERLCAYFECDVGDLLYFEYTEKELPQDPDQIDD